MLAFYFYKTKKFKNAVFIGIFMLLEMIQICYIKEILSEERQKAGNKRYFHFF